MTQGRKGRLAAGAIMMIATLKGTAFLAGVAAPVAAKADGLAVRYEVVDRGAGYQVQPIAPAADPGASLPSVVLALGRNVHFDAAMLEPKEGGHDAHHQGR